MFEDDMIRNIAKAVIALNKALAAARVGPAVVIGLPKHHLNTLALLAAPDAKERQGIASIAGVALIPYEREHAPPLYGASPAQKALDAIREMRGETDPP